MSNPVEDKQLGGILLNLLPIVTVAQVRPDGTTEYVDSNDLTRKRAMKELLAWHSQGVGEAEAKAQIHWEAIDSLTSVGMLLVPKSNAWEELHKQISKHMDAYHLLKFGRTLSDANKKFWEEKMKGTNHE